MAPTRNRQIFHGLRCCFLGFNEGGKEKEQEKQKLIKGFVARGGIQENYCRTEITKYLVATTWTEVEWHFRDKGSIIFPGLLEHFIINLQIVSYEWIYFCISTGKLVEYYKYELHPEPHERICLSPTIFDRADEYKLSPDELKAMMERYRKLQIDELCLIYEDIKKKKRRVTWKQVKMYSKEGSEEGPYSTP